MVTITAFRHIKDDCPYCIIHIFLLDLRNQNNRKLLRKEKMKLLTLCLAVACFLLSFTDNAAAQCVPDANACTIADPMMPACIDPDSLEFEVGKNESKTIQLLLGRTVPTGLPFPREIYLSSMDVLSIDKVPAGLGVKIYSANGADDVNGKNQGKITPKDGNTPMHMCVVISGATTEANTPTDSIEIVANVKIKLLGTNGQPTGDEFDPNTLAPGTNPFVFTYRISSVNPSSVSEKIPGVGMMTFSVSPNPVNEITYVRFSTPKGGDATITITDVQGKIVWKEVFSALDAGDHILPIQTQHLPEGVYTVQLQAFDTPLMQKFIK